MKPNDDNEYGGSPSVHQDYKNHSEKHIVPALGSKRVCGITIRDVDQFLKSKSDSGQAVATVQYIHRVLRRALNFAVDWNVIGRNPASARMRTAKRRKPVPSTMVGPSALLSDNEYFLGFTAMGIIGILDLAAQRELIDLRAAMERLKETTLATAKTSLSACRRSKESAERETQMP